MFVHRTVTVHHALCVYLQDEVSGCLRSDAANHPAEEGELQHKSPNGPYQPARAAAAGRAEAARLRVCLAGPRAASAVVVMLLCRHEASLQLALRLAATSLRLEQWPALLALACRVDRAGVLRGGAGASLLLLEALLSAWPADICFRLLRRQPCLADALPPEGFALLLQAVKKRRAL